MTSNYRDDLLQFAEQKYPDDYAKVREILYEFEGEQLKKRAYSLMDKIKVMYPDKQDVVKLFQNKL